MQSQTPVISSQAYYPNLDHNHRLRNSIAPAVEPYGLEKRFPIPRSDMYSYDHYPNHIRPAYDPYPYYHPVTISNSPAPIMEVEEKKTQERVVKSSVRSVDEESDDERKKRFLERNRVAGTLFIDDSFKVQTEEEGFNAGVGTEIFRIVPEE